MKQLGAVARLFSSRQFVLFLAAGGFAALVNWLARFFLNDVISYEWALVGGYAAGMATAFLLNRWLVFPPSGAEYRTEVARFVVVNMISFPVVWATSFLLSEYAMPALDFRFHPREIAHAFAVACPAALSFLAHKFWTFGHPSGAGRAAR